MIMLLIGLFALLALGVIVSGFRQVSAARRQRKPVGNAVASISGGVLMLVLAGGLGALQQSASRPTVTYTSPPPSSPASASTPEASTTTYVTPEQVEIERAEAEGRAPNPVRPPNPSGRTDAQNLAIVAGRDQDDPEIAAKLARLDAACPEEAASPGDMVVSLHRIVLKESGRDLDIVNVLDQFITAQEGPAQEGGMKCSETGGMLAALMVQGM